MIDLGKFFNEEVEPKLIFQIKALFPEFTYNDRSKQWESPYKMDGHSKPSEPRRDKTIIALKTIERYSHYRALEQGGASLDLIELIKMRFNVNFVDAVKLAAKEVGVEVPSDNSFDAEKYQKRKEKQQRLQAILQRLKEELFKPSGAQVLEYLKSVRGYSEEYIKAQPFGFIDASMKDFKELQELFHYTRKDGKECKVLSFVNAKGIGIGAGYTHKFATAIFSSGEIKGFIFRTIMNDEEILSFKHHYERFAKYYTAYIGEFDTQGFFPIALPIARFTSYDKTLTNVTIVEGVLDTYRALYAGIKNVIGLSQGALNKTQIERLKAKGAKEITLLMDTEALLTKDGASNEAAIKANEDRVVRAVELASSYGLKSYVCYLPSPDGNKVDIDSFFQGLEGDALRAKAQELQTIIDEAQGGFTFIYKQKEKEYLETSRTERNKYKLLRDTISIIKKMDKDIALSEKGDILNLCAKATNKDLSQQEIEEYLRAAPLEPDEKKVLELRKKYRGYETIEQKDLRRKGKRSGLLLNFTNYSKDGKQEEPFMLPSGAITYICLPSGHGKTRLLENIALQLLQNGEKGLVLFVSVEEDVDAIEDEFVSIYYTSQHIEPLEKITSKADFLRQCDEARLSNNHLRTIGNYYSEEEDAKKYEYFRGKGDNYRLIEDFEQSRKEFYTKFVYTEQLKILSVESQSIEEVIEAIKFLDADLREEGSNKSPLKAVCLDYAQRMKKKGFSVENKKAMLTEITNDLMSLSVELQIPFVVAAQLNKKTYSPLDMGAENISDAIEIEQSGSIVAVGWNSGMDAKREGSYYKDKSSKTETEDASDFRNRTGITLGEKGDIYLCLVKNRKGIPSVESRLYFDGNSGLIIQGERKIDRDAKFLAQTQSLNEKRNFKPSASAKKNITAKETMNDEKQRLLQMEEEPPLPFKDGKFIEDFHEEEEEPPF